VRRPSLESSCVELNVLFLGTAGAVPTAQRAPAAVLVRRGGDRILIDCGEGTQRQLLRSGVGLVDVEDIFVTHYHADHFLGLPGLLKTFALRGREAPLHLHGPAGLADLVRSLARIFGRLTYRVELVEAGDGDVVVRDGYRIEVFRTSHGVASVGYSLVEDGRPGRFDVGAAAALGVPAGPLYGVLQRGEAVTLAGGATVRPEQVLGASRPGRRVVFSGDTRPCLPLVRAARGADLLVHEATFLDAEADRAGETGHSTAGQAARLAREAGVKLLALTHLSTRYFGREIQAEARAEFPHSIVPRDFDLVELPLPERGEPQLVKARDRLSPDDLPEVDPLAAPAEAPPA
jgi:ribonuclease Z